MATTHRRKNSGRSILSAVLVALGVAVLVWGCGDAATGSGATADASPDVSPGTGGDASATADGTTGDDAGEVSDASADVVLDTAAMDACAYNVIFDGGGCGAASCTTTTTVIDPASCGLPAFSTPAGKAAAQAFCDMLTPHSGDSRLAAPADGGGFTCMCCTA